MHRLSDTKSYHEETKSSNQRWFSGVLQGWWRKLQTNCLRKSIQVTGL